MATLLKIFLMVSKKEISLAVISRFANEHFIWPCLTPFDHMKWAFQKWIKQKWEDSDFMNSTEEEQWNKITKMFDAIGIDIESVFNHIESLLGVKVEQNPSISP